MEVSDPVKTARLIAWNLSIALASAAVIVGMVHATAWVLSARATTVAAWWAVLWIAGESARRQFESL